MKIHDNIEIVDLALKIKNTLIIADTHIGYEEALNQQGLMVPRFQFNDIVKHLEAIFDKHKINRIIINGDIKHEFGTISKQEWKDTLKLLGILNQYCSKIVLIKGNHDTILGPIARKKNVEVVEYYKLDEIFITHGHKIPTNDEFKKAKTVIIGHDHPAVSIKESLRTERFKCFLKGRYKNKILIVQPSFNFVIEGTSVLKEKLLSPFLQGNLMNFDIFVVADKVYKFGKLRNLA